MSNRSLAARTAGFAAFCLLAALGAARVGWAGDINRVIRVNIDDQPLATALTSLAKQADLHILFAPAVVDGLQAARLSGNYSVAQALKALLANADLEFVIEGEDTIVVRERRPIVRTPTADPPAPPAATTTSVAPPGATGLQEIVVTATKRTEDLQKAPAAITAVSGETLVDLGINNIEGVAALIPSARFEPINAATHLYIRGIGAEQDRVFVNQLVAMVVDGVYLPREATGMSQVDVRQIEVLPGPQGTLYGPGAVGGVVSVANNRPTKELEASSSVEFGNYSRVHGSLVENLPINDVLWVRGAFDYSKHGAYETGGVDTTNAFGGRLSLLAMPTDSFSAYVWGSYWRDTGVPGNAIVVTGNGPTFVHSSNPWDALACSNSPCSFIPRQDIGPNRGDTSAAILAGQFDWHLNGATLSMIPSYVDNDSNVISYAGPLSEAFVSSHRQYTNELRLTGDSTGRLKWIGGLYYFKSNDFQDYAVGGPHNPVVRNREESYAGYGQLTWSVLDALRLTGGLRYSWQRKEDDFFAPALDPASHVWRPLDWKAGLETDLAPRSMLYATIQTGFANGTFDPVNPEGNRPGFVKETKLLSYTAGIKNRFFGDRLELNNEVFYYDYKNYLIQTVIIHHDGTASNGFFTAKKVGDYGDQLDVRALLTDQLQLQAGIGYLHARTKDFNTGQATYNDYELFESPEWTVTAGAKYRWDLSSGSNIVVVVSSHYEIGYWGDFPHATGARQESFTKTDASLTYHASDDRWSVGLWANNLENQAQLNPGAHIGAGVTQGVFYITPPRTYGIRATAMLGSR